MHRKLGLHHKVNENYEQQHTQRDLTGGRGKTRSHALLIPVTAYTNNEIKNSNKKASGWETILGLKLYSYNKERLNHLIQILHGQFPPPIDPWWNQTLILDQCAARKI